MLPVVEVIHKGPFLGARFYLCGFVKETIIGQLVKYQRTVAVVASLDTGIFREFLAEHVRLLTEEE
jgi:hypothetical protein